MLNIFTLALSIFKPRPAALSVAAFRALPETERRATWASWSQAVRFAFARQLFAERIGAGATEAEVADFVAECNRRNGLAADGQPLQVAA